MELKTKKNLKGWIMVVGCMFIQAIPFSIACSIQPQFMGYVVKDKGFTLGAFSLIFTISTIIGAVASPIIGKLYAKYNAKILLLIGGILAGVGFLSFGFAKGIIAFYLIGGITQVGVAMLSSIGVPLIINSWFSEEIKGKALGLTFAGGAFGNIFVQQFAAVSLINFGPSKSYIIFGLASLVVSIPVVIFILRMPKSGDEVLKGKEILGETKRENIGYSLMEAKNLKYFWTFAIGLILIGLYISGVMVQYPSYLKNIGVNPALIGSVGSVIAIFSLIGNLLGGTLFDKLGVTKCIAMAGVSASLGGIALLITSKNSNLAFVFAGFLGISIFSYIMGVAYMTGVFFGKKEYGAILGMLNLMFAIGYAIGSSLFGMIVEKGGYNITWSIIVLIIIVAYSLIVFTSIGMKKINNKLS